MCSVGLISMHHIIQKQSSLFYRPLSYAWIDDPVQFTKDVYYILAGCAYETWITRVLPLHFPQLISLERYDTCVLQRIHNDGGAITV